MKFLYLTVIILFMNGLVNAAQIQLDLFGKQLEVTIRDGMTNKPLAGELMAPNKWKTKDGLDIHLFPSEKSGKMFCKIVFSVPSESKNIHRLTVEAVCKTKGVKYFFDGFKKRTWNGETTLERDTILETFPLAAVWDQNSGMALGLSPDSIVSYMRNGVRHSNATDELFFSTRVVVDARRKQEITFCAFKFKPEFGWRNAVENYYNEYPEYFKPVAGIDKRIYGIGGYFTSTHITRDLEIHSGRQLNMTWEWTYVPWNRAGEWYVNKDNWKPGDGYFWWDKYMKNHPCTWKEYHMAETKRFKSGNRQAAMLFYVLLKDIHKELIERYPQSRGKNSLGKLSTYSHNHSRPDNKGKTYDNFAYGSGLAQYLENEIKQVVENYQVSGFAFDMANWDDNQYCDAQMNYAVGRSFDKNGKIYTANSILPILFAQYIHTLKKEGKTIAVYNNQALENQAALSVFYSDAVMFEGNPEMQINNLKALRLMSGQKPMTCWGDVGANCRNNAFDWNDILQNDNAKQHVIKGLAQYLLFYCLRYGISPMNWAVARERELFSPWLSIIVDLKRAGWNVVPAIKCIPKADLWYGRFGMKLNTIFTITNPTRKPVETTIRIFNSYLGTDKYVPKAVTGQLINPERKGDFTEFAIKLQPKEIMVLRDANWKADSPVFLSPEKQIIGFFTMDDAKTGNVTVIALDDKAKVIYDYFDRYFPYIQAGRDYCGSIFTREVFKLDPKYNDCWHLPVKKALSSGKQIVIGTLEQFPQLAALLNEAEKAEISKNNSGFIKVFPKQSILWIGGNNIADLRKVSEKYFELMDKKHSSKRKTNKQES